MPKTRKPVVKRSTHYALPLTNCCAVWTPRCWKDLGWIWDRSVSFCMFLLYFRLRSTALHSSPSTLDLTFPLRPVCALSSPSFPFALDVAHFDYIKKFSLSVGPSSFCYITVQSVAGKILPRFSLITLLLFLVI